MSPNLPVTCPKCGSTLQPGQSQCPSCGQVFRWNQPSEVPSPNNGKQLWIGAAVALIVVAIGLGTMMATGILKLNSRPNEPVLDLKTKTQPVLTQKNEPPPPPGERTAMPDAIKEWLLHLERIENKRGDLAKRQVGQALALMTQIQAKKLLGAMSEESGASPATMALSIDTFTKEWQSLSEDFRSLPPPPECTEIAQTYDPVIVKVGESVIQILTHIQSSIDDPDSAQQVVAELSSMTGKSSKEIDQPAKQTDALVGEICARYSERKWFSIEGDYGSGMGSIFSSGLGL